MSAPQDDTRSGKSTIADELARMAETIEFVPMGSAALDVDERLCPYCFATPEDGHARDCQFFNVMVEDEYARYAFETGEPTADLLELRQQEQELRNG